MKINLHFICMVLILTVTGTQVSAQFFNVPGIPIAHWDFEDNADRNILETTVDQSINSGCTFDGKFGGASTTVCQATGDGMKYASLCEGTAISSAGWPSVTIDPTTSASAYFQFSMNTSGFSGTKMVFDVFSGNNTINYPQVGVIISYDGGNSWNHNITTTTSNFLPNEWTNISVTLAAAGDNNPDVKIRIYGFKSDNNSNCLSGSFMKIDNVLFCSTGLVKNAGQKIAINESQLGTSYTCGMTGGIYFRSGTITIDSASTLVLADSHIGLGGNGVTGAMVVKNGGTLICGNSNGHSRRILGDVSGNSSFTLDAGATLVVMDPDGITAGPANTGAVRTANRNFSIGADYVYAGSGATVTGDGLPTVLKGNLTINAPGSVTLSQATTLWGGSSLFLEKGSFVNGSFLFMNDSTTINRNGATLTDPPVFNGDIDLIYSGSTNVVTGNELPTSVTALKNITIDKSANGTVTLNDSCTVNGDFILLEGEFIQQNGATPNHLKVAGDFNLSGGKYNFGSGAGQPTLTLYRNFIQSGTAEMTTSGSSPNGEILFNKTGIQSFSAALPNMIKRTQYTVARGSILQLLSHVSVDGNPTSNSTFNVLGILDCKTFTITGSKPIQGSYFMLDSAAIMITAHPTGIYPGSIANNSFTTHQYNYYANYIFNGNVHQEANLSNPYLQNLTIDNPSGVTISTQSVNGALTLANGTMSVEAGKFVGLYGNINVQNGNFGGTTTSSIFILGSGNITAPVSFEPGQQQLQHFTIDRTGVTVTLGSPLSIAGSWQNSGDFNANNHTVTFNGTSYQRIQGSSPTVFAGLTIDAANNVIVEAIGQGGGAISNTGTLTLVSGTYKLTASNSSASNLGGLTIPPDAVLELNGGDFNSYSGSVTNNGIFRIVSGNAMVANNLICNTGGLLDFEGGNLNVTACLRNVGGTINLHGTTITLAQFPLNNAFQAAFQMDGDSHLDWISGNINLQNANSGNGGDINIQTGTGIKNHTGGILRFGTSSSPAGQVFNCNSQMPFFEMTVVSTNSPEVNLLNDLTVNGALHLNGGNVVTNAFNVIVPITGGITRVNGHVQGNLRMGFNAGTTTRVFNIGDAGTYAPVSLTNTSTTSSGYVTAYTVPGISPGENNPVSNSSGLELNARANRYWILTPSPGYAMINAGATFNFSAGEASGNPLNYKIRKFNAGAWSATSSSTITAVSSACTGLSSLGEFITGESNQLSVDINPSNVIACPGDVVSFASTVSSGSIPAPTVKWQENSGSGFIDIIQGGIYGNPALPQLTISGVLPSMDNYQYRAVFTNINGTTTSSAAILDLNMTTTANAGTDQVLCNTSATTLSGNIASPNSGIWTVIAGGATVTNAANPSSGVTGLTPGTNTFRWGISNGTCSSFDDVSVFVNSAPLQPSVISGPSDICPPATGIVLSVANDPSATSYSWFAASGTNGVTFNPPSGTNTQVIDIAPTTNSTYTIKVTSTNLCGTSPFRSITIRRSVSTPAAVTGPATVCANGSYSYSTGVVTGATSYIWSGPAGTIFNGSNPTPYTTVSNTVTALMGPAFTSGAIGVAAQVGCFTSPVKSLAISQSAAPVSVISGNSSACPNTSYTYSVSPVSGAATYNWTLPAGASGNSNSNSINVTYGASVSASNICVTAASICGIITAPRCLATYSGVPARPASIAGPTNGLCGR